MRIFNDLCRKNRKNWPLALGFLFSTLLTPDAEALDYNFSGFATLGAATVTEDQVYFGDYEQDWSFNTDTVFGLQFQASLADRLTLTTQVISQGFNYDNVNKYEPELDWLFLSYELTESLRTRVGRMRTPFYLFSETMEVGYSYVWVRPPIDVYTPLLSPFRNFDGADITYTTDLFSDTINADLEFESQFFVGFMEGFFLDNNIDVEPSTGIVLSLSLNQTKVRYSGILLKVKATNDVVHPLTVSLEEASQVSPALVRTSQGFETDGEWYQYHSLGFLSEWDSWSLIAENYYIYGTGKELSNDARGYYISLIYQYRDVSPYIVFGRYKNVLESDVLGGVNKSFDEIPRGVSPSLDQLRDTTLEVIDDFNVKERTYTAGIRWDIVPNVAVKAEYQFFEFMDHSSGHMISYDSNDKAENSSLITLTLDLVF